MYESDLGNWRSPAGADLQALLLGGGQPALSRLVAPSYFTPKPLFRRRMDAHRLWKSERGASDYTDAIQLELY